MPDLKSSFQKIIIIEKKKNKIIFMKNTMMMNKMNTK